MTETEVSKLLAVIMGAYTTFNPANAAVTTEVWFKALEKENAKEINKILDNWIVTEKYPPTISDLLNAKRKLLRSEELNAEVAWGLVMKAISASGYNSVAEYAKLPKMAQRALGSPSTLRDMAINENFNEGVEKSHFVKSYNQVLERQRNYESLTDELKLVHDRVNANSNVARLETKIKLLIEQAAQRLKLENNKETYIALDESKYAERINSLYKK